MSKGKPFYERNKHLQTWIPSKLYLWFCDYLQKYSYGATFTEQFRMFLYKLQEQEEKGITIANPRKDFEQQVTLKRDLQQKPAEAVPMARKKADRARMKACCLFVNPI